MKKKSQQKTYIAEMKAENKKLKAESKGLKKEKFNIKKVLQKMLSINNKSSAPLSVQDSLPFERITADGIMQIDEQRFSKTIEFGELNYRLARVEEQDRIFGKLCEFINYFDASIDVQMSLVNHTGNLEYFRNLIKFPHKNDGYDGLRDEFIDVLDKNLCEGNNEILKRKFLTFTIKADNIDLARQRLSKLSGEIEGQLEDFGVHTKPLDGKARVALLQSMLNRFEGTPNIVYISSALEDAKKGYITTKDIICPSSFSFKNKDFCTSGKAFVSTVYLDITCSELDDRMLQEFLDLNEDIVITKNFTTISQAEAIKAAKRHASNIDAMKIDYQQKAIKAGFDYDILPPDIKIYSEAAAENIENLHDNNERQIITQFFITVNSKTKKQLTAAIYAIKGIAQKYSCRILTLDYQQEHGYFTSLPLGKSFVKMNRILNTSSLAIQIPFSAQELQENAGEAMYIGKNVLTKNIIMVDRKKLFNQNGLILGVPGSGKSFAAKREIANAFLFTGDDVMICDPQDEYWPLTKLLGGQVIDISANSKTYINPLDIPKLDDGTDPIALKCEFMMSLFELILARSAQQSLYPDERSLIDRCVRSSYRKYLENPSPENMPILEDVYNLLLSEKKSGVEAAKYLTDGLDMYISGTYKIFNHRTNVDYNNRIVCYNIKSLGAQLKRVGMLIVQDQIFNRVSENKGRKSTRYYCDEFHLLLKEPQTAQFSVRVFKEFRKFGGIPTGITQNITDFLASPEIENILQNTPYIVMLNQSARDREELQAALNISDSQMRYITNVKAGHGLLFYGYTTVPFEDKFPENTKLYKYLTTKPDEVMLR